MESGRTNQAERKSYTALSSLQRKNIACMENWCSCQIINSKVSSCKVKSRIQNRANHCDIFNIKFETLCYWPTIGKWKLLYVHDTVYSSSIRIMYTKNCHLHGECFCLNVEGKKNPRDYFHYVKYLLKNFLGKKWTKMLIITAFGWDWMSYILWFFIFSFLCISNL